MIIAVIHATFAVAKRKTEENSGLYGIRTLDLCDTGAALYRRSEEFESRASLSFFRLSFRNCKSYVYNGDDHPSFNSSFRSSHM